MIRRGIEADIDQIVELAREFWKHTLFDDEFCPDTVYAMSQTCIKDHQLMAVLEIDGKLQGFACGVKGPLLANSEILCGTEIAWWVDEKHRKGRNGISLLKELERQAQQAGIKYWTMGFMESSMPDIVEGIYIRMGYNKSETLFTKVI